MRNQTIRRAPTTKVGVFQEKVPFNTELLIAEQDLDQMYTIEPIEDLGTPESLKPVPGCQVIYRLVGTGDANVPILGASFNKEGGSADFDTDLNAVNLLSMWYDGAEFWYSVSNFNPPPVPSSECMAKIGDLGLGPDVLMVFVNPAATGYISPDDPPVYATDFSIVSAFDVISSIHYLGTEQLIYSIAKDDGGGAPGVWVSNTDPRLAQLEFDCDSLGQQAIWIQVDDNNSLTSPAIFTYVMNQANGGIGTACNEV